MPLLPRTRLLKHLYKIRNDANGNMPRLGFNAVQIQELHKAIQRALGSHATVASYILETMWLSELAPPIATLFIFSLSLRANFFILFWSLLAKPVSRNQLAQLCLAVVIPHASG